MTFSIPTMQMSARAPELFGQATAQIIIYHGGMTGLIFAEGSTFAIYGTYADCSILQLTGERVKGEIVDGAYGQGTEKPVRCSLDQRGRGWIDFRGHHRLFELRTYARN
jgi:hypothetical protein